MKGAIMQDVVDLCSSSDEESPGPVTKQGPQSGMNLIVIDDSSDDYETTPPKQDVIEIDSSSDDETPQVQESVARMPSPGAGYDSSDDDQALLISRQRAAQLRKKLPSQPTPSASEKLDASKPAAVPKLPSNGSARATNFGRQRHPAIIEPPHDEGQRPRATRHAHAEKPAPRSPERRNMPGGKSSALWNGDRRKTPPVHQVRRDVGQQCNQRDIALNLHLDREASDSHRTNDAHSKNQSTFKLAPRTPLNHDRTGFGIKNGSKPMAQPNRGTAKSPFPSEANDPFVSSDNANLLNGVPFFGRHITTGKLTSTSGANAGRDKRNSLTPMPPILGESNGQVQQRPVNLSSNEDRRSDSKVSPRKHPSSLNDAKRQVLHMNPVGIHVKRGHKPSAAPHLSPVDSRVKRALTPFASVPSPKKYVRPGINGEKRPVNVSFGGNRAKRPENVRPNKLFAMETVKLCLSKHSMKRSKRKAPSPLENELVPLRRTNGNKVSRLQNSIRKFASAKAPSSENVRPRSSPRKSALKRPTFSSRKIECGPQSCGRGLNDYNVASQSRTMLPTVPETRQIDGTVTLTACDKQHIVDDETDVDKAQTLSLSSRQPDTSEASSSSMTMSLQSKGLSNADSSGGGNAIPLDNSSGERSTCHSPITDSQGGRIPTNSVIGTAASSEMMVEEALVEDALASPGSLNGKLSKQDSSLAESDSSHYRRSSPNCSDFAASLDFDSDDMSDEFVAEEPELSTADLHVQLIDSDIQLWKRSTRKEVDYKEPRQFKMTESQTYEYSPPARTMKDRASADSNGDEEPIVARASQRKKKKVQIFSPVLDTSEDEEEGVFGVQIEHSSKYTYDRLGRPTYHFSVMGADDTIYDLKIVVKESTIPDSGLGAYLTFLGARVLNEAVEDVEQLSRESLVVNEESLTMPLEATSPDGFGISVTLTGATLKGKTCESVLGDHGHVDGSCPKLIGGLGVYNESDFVLHPDIELVSKTGVIDIGRYGPVKKTDRLPQYVADIKNFIFSDEVETYGYDVDELIHGPIHGTRQFVDITDNATGFPHKESRRLIPSYINEVGHNPSLKRNVHIRSKEDRSVHYYLDLKDPLKYRETVELFVDYDQSYEDVRERKGYGIANIENGEKSNEHEPTALWRYFDRREFISEEIDKFSPLNMYYTLEFIVENVQEPIDAIVGEYVNKGQGFIRGKPTDLQLRARRRMHWLSDVFLARISTLLDEHPEALSQAHVPYNSLLNQSKRWAENLKWHSFAKDTRSLKDRDNMAYDTLIKASREDVLYSLSSKIVMPLKEAMWCPAAVELIKRLSRHTALVSSLGGDDVPNLLWKRYLKCAKKTAMAIRQACKAHNVGGCAPDLLKFVTDVKKDERIDVNALMSFGGFKESGFFRKHTTFRKGIIASLLEIQSYRDAMALSCLPEQFNMVIVPDRENSTHEVLIAKEFGSVNVSMGAADEGVVGYPRHTDFFARGGRINETWYLLWQVIFVVHCFAEKFVGSNGGHFSLEELCAVVGVDIASARAVVEQGIETKEYYINLTSKNGKVSPKKKKSPPKKRSKTQTATQIPGPLVNRKLFDEIIWKKTLVQELGWTLDVGNRPTDYYYLPPGVQRGRGFASRKDYFDSVTQVMNFITKDSRWKDEPKVVEALALFGKLTVLIEKLKPKNDFDLNWLIGQLDVKD